MVSNQIVHKVLNVMSGRYVGRCMRAYGKGKVWTDRKLLSDALKHNNIFYGDNRELVVHSFVLTKVKAQTAKDFEES